MSRDTLLLNGGTFEPLVTMDWQRALTLVYQDKVYVVEEYSDWTVSSAQEDFTVPSVLALDEYIDFERVIPATRRNIYARDNFSCQYCGVDAKDGSSDVAVHDLTFDHVLPSSRGGETSWTNIVTACEHCNVTKGDQTPQEANMALRNEPARPEMNNPLCLELKGREVPDNWRKYFSRPLS